MNLDLNNSDNVDFPNLMVRYNTPLFVPSGEELTAPQRLPIGSRLDDDYNYGFDGGEFSNAKGSPKGGTLDEIIHCGKRPKITNSVKGHAWGRCVTDFHFGSGTVSPNDIKAHCGKRPFWIGKRRKVYNKCKADLLGAVKAKVIADRAALQAQQDSTAQAEADRLALQATLANAQAIQSSLVQQQNAMQTTAPKSAPTPTPDNTTNDRPFIDPKPKSSSNTGLIIGIGALVLIGGFVTWKLIKNKQG